MWSFDTNTHDDWNLSHIIVENGRLNLDYWVNQIKNNRWIKSHIIPEIDNFEQNDQSGNTISTINVVTRCLKYKSNQHINTVDIYKHPDYIIQAMYINDYDYATSDNLNYCATLINNEKMQIYETVVFFKIKDGLTIDLDLSEILSLLSNFYYVRAVKLSYGKFEEICVNNFEPEMDRLFKTYERKIIGSWIVLCESKKTLDKVQASQNDVSQLHGVVWFKLKKYTGDVSLYHETFDNNKGGDYRGLYENIDEQYVRQIFFNNTAVKNE